MHTRELNRSHHSIVPCETLRSKRSVCLIASHFTSLSSPRCSDNRVSDVVASHQTCAHPTRTRGTVRSMPCFPRRDTCAHLWDHALVCVTDVSEAQGNYHCHHSCFSTLRLRNPRFEGAKKAIYIYIFIGYINSKHLSREIGSRVRHSLIGERITDHVVRGCQSLPGWPTDFDLFSSLRVDSIFLGVVNSFIYKGHKIVKW